LRTGTVPPLWLTVGSRRRGALGWVVLTRGRVRGRCGCSKIFDLLDRPEGFTLEELLAEDELLQEVKGYNEQIINLCGGRARPAWVVGGGDGG
jgi:hypothetical protein